jgi:hypothetical protein
MRLRVLFVSSVTGIVCAVALCLALGADPDPVCAGAAPLTDDPVTTHTAYLPLTVSRFDPTWLSPFGIAMYGDVGASSGLEKMEEAGSAWVTTMLHWSSIESAPGSYDWSGFDEKAQNARAAAMEPFVLFTGNPSWAAALPGGPVTDTQDLVDFVSIMAERYDGDGLDDAPNHPRVRYWSFYAEPDNGDLGRAQTGKGYWGHDGAGYAAMLSQVAPAIHAANPNAQVLIGGLAYDWFEEDGGPFVRSFLTDTLAALNGYPGGAGAYIDAVAFHFYPIAQFRWPTIAQKAQEIRDIMERHGLTHLPLVSPEMGYWSAEEAGSSEGIQARRLVQMYLRGISVGLEHMSWFTVFDNGGGTSEHGLFRGQSLEDPKEAYTAYVTLVEELEGGHYQEPLEAAGVEGYAFHMPGGQEKTVLWATSGYVDVPFPHSCLRLVDTTGGEYCPIVDGQPGWDMDGDGHNGMISVRIWSNSPFYVEPCP